MKYILNGKIPVPEEDTIKWAIWLASNNRCVGRTKIGDTDVSTVFLGLDHNYRHGAPPILFETMIFRDTPKGKFKRKETGLNGSDHYQIRYCTWDKALKGHRKTVHLLKYYLKGKKK